MRNWTLAPEGGSKTRVPISVLSLLPGGTGQSADKTGNKSALVERESRHFFRRGCPWRKHKGTDQTLLDFSSNHSTYSANMPTAAACLCPRTEPRGFEIKHRAPVTTAPLKRFSVTLAKRLQGLDSGLRRSEQI